MAAQVTRSDARDNRDRILEAAREVFADQGLDVPMREIARRAEVGPATLYRHFPSKGDLVTAAFAEQMRACERIIDEALADPDPWQGFCSVIEKVFDLHARDRGFTSAFVSAYPQAVDRDASLAKMAQLAARAKSCGRLRSDFVVEDLVLVIMANGGIRSASPTLPLAASVTASRRFAALAIEAFRASPSTHPLPPAARVPLASVRP